MALDPLATDVDLQVKGVDTETNPELVLQMLAVASAVIRDAAGAVISLATSTIKILAPDSEWMTLPSPARSVQAVRLDGVAVSDWKFVGGRLWRRCGWGNHCEPVEAEIEVTHGYDAVPDDIVNLCVDLAILGINAASDESLLSQPANVVSVSSSIDDYTERLQFSEEDARTVMELPDGTRRWLATRFGGGVHVTGVQR